MKLDSPIADRNAEMDLPFRKNPPLLQLSDTCFCLSNQVIMFANEVKQQTLLCVPEEIYRHCHQQPEKVILCYLKKNEKDLSVRFGNLSLLHHRMPLPYVVNPNYALKRFSYRQPPHSLLHSHRRTDAKHRLYRLYPAAVIADAKALVQVSCSSLSL